MGRLFLVQLDDSYPGQDLIVCRICKTQLALAPDAATVCKVLGFMGGLFSNVVNVHVDKSSTRKFKHCTVQDVHCTKCCDLMGLKLVEVSGEAGKFVQTGQFLLNMDKIVALTPELEMLEYQYSTQEVEAADDQEEQA